MFSSVLTIVVPKWGAPNNWMLCVQQWLLHIGEHHKNSVAHKSCQSKFFNAHVKQMQLGDTSEYVNQLCPMLFSVVLLLLGFLNTTVKNYCVHFWQMVLQPEILSHFFLYVSSTIWRHIFSNNLLNSEWKMFRQIRRTFL